MSVVEMKMPSPGESIMEVEIATLLVADGEYVDLDQPIAEIDSDKATLELNAEVSGAVTFMVEEGQTINVGDVVCKIDTSVKGESKKATAKVEEAVAVEATAEVAAAPVVEEKAAPAPAPVDVKATPVAEKMMTDNGVPAGKVKGTGTGGKITKGDVVAYMAGGISSEAASGWGGTRDTERKKMSTLRRKVAQRLVSVKNETAMLTTFNEVNMKPIMDLRKKYKDKFMEVHGVKLGFMGFFTKACAEALNLFPAVNAMIDGDDMITHNYADIGMAVSTPKGLMVPVVRNA